MVNTKTFRPRVGRVPKRIKTTPLADDIIRDPGLLPLDLKDFWDPLVRRIEYSILETLKENTSLPCTVATTPRVLHWPIFDTPSTMSRAPVVVLLETKISSRDHTSGISIRGNGKRYKLEQLNIDDPDTFAAGLADYIGEAIHIFKLEYAGFGATDSVIAGDVDPMKCPGTPMSFRVNIEGVELCLIFGYWTAMGAVFSPLSGATADSPRNYLSILGSTFSAHMERTLKSALKTTWGADAVIANGLRLVADYFAQLDIFLPSALVASLYRCMIDRAPMHQWVAIKGELQTANSKLCEVLICVAYLLLNPVDLANSGLHWDLLLLLPEAQRSTLAATAAQLVDMYEDEEVDLRMHLFKTFGLYFNVVEM